MALFCNNCVVHCLMTICGGVGNLKWREGIFFLSFFSPNPTFSHFHMALLGNNGDWQRRNELRWNSCHRQRKKGKHSFQRMPQAKPLQNMFKIVYLPSLSSLMNEFLVARLCSAHLFIKIEKCVNAIHYSIWREQSNFISNMKLTTLRDKISPPRWTSS